MTTPGNYTRCITGNGGPPRIPGGVTAESQILQTPGYVVMVHQSNKDVRIIPLDGRPHLPKTVGQWLGDARGRWEGTTLVVETTNFNQRNWRGSNEAMHLVERFTLVGPKTLRYQFTVTDPDDVDETVVDRQPPPEDRSADLRVRLPRAELRIDQLDDGHADPGKRSGTSRSNRAARARGTLKGTTCGQQ